MPSTPRTSTRRTALAKGTVLQADTTSAPSADDSKTSKLKSRSPDFSTRVRRRSRTRSRFSSSSPTIRYAGRSSLILYSLAHRGYFHPLARSEEHTSELQLRQYLVCRLLLEKKKSFLHSFHSLS